MNKSEAAEFARQCEELGEQINNLLFGYPKAVAIYTLGGVMAGASHVLGVPRDDIIAMFDSALENIDRRLRESKGLSL